MRDSDTSRPDGLRITNYGLRVPYRSGGPQFRLRFRAQLALPIVDRGEHRRYRGLEIVEHFPGVGERAAADLLRLAFGKGDDLGPLLRREPGNLVLLHQASGLIARGLERLLGLLPRPVENAAGLL